MPIKNLLENLEKSIKVFMRSSNSSDEDQNPEAGAEENTIIVESWLDFVAAHEDKDNSSSLKGLNSEIKDKIQELCVRIDAMLEEQKLFCAELDRLSQNNPAIEVSNELLPGLPPVKPPASEDAKVKPKHVCANSSVSESKRSFPGRKMAMRILQIFKRSHKD